MRRAQRKSAERSIFDSHSLQRFSPHCEPIIQPPVRNAQRLLLPVNPPKSRVFNRNICRSELAGSNGVPEHFAGPLLENDDIEKIEIEQWTQQCSEVARQFFRR